MLWESISRHDDQFVCFSLSLKEDGLRQLYEGLQLYRALLSSLSNYPRLANKDKVTELMADVRDLAIQIKKVGECF